MSKKTSEQAGVPGEGNDQEPTSANDRKMLTMEQVQEQIAETRSELEQEFNERVERDVSNVRSQLMRAHSQREQEWQEQQEAYEDRIRNLETKDMDEDERAKYEANAYRSRVEEMKGQLSELQAELNASRNMGAYVTGLVKGFGIDPTKLDLTDPDALSESAWEAATTAYQSKSQKVEELEQELAKVRKGGDETPPEEKPPVEKAPDVVTGIQGASKGSPTLLDLRKSASEKMGLDHTMSEAELLDLAKHPDITGIDLNDVLPALQAEIDAEKQQS